MGIFHEVLVGQRRVFIYVSDIHDGSFAYPVWQGKLVMERNSSGKDASLEALSAELWQQTEESRSNLFDKLELLSVQAGGAISHKPVFMHQKHSTAVRPITYGNSSLPVEADAMVTTDMPIAVMTADCVPLVLVTECDGILLDYAVVHAGRVGLLSGIIQETSRLLLVRKPDRINAFVGPHICAKCYEVSRNLYEESQQQLPEVAATSRWGTPAINLLGGARAIFEGISQAEQIKIVISLLTPHGIAADRPKDTEDEYSWCTYENKDFFSYRRFTRHKNNATRRSLSNNNNFYHGANDGRFASVAWVN